MTLFEQGGAAPKVTGEQLGAIADAMWGPPIRMSRPEFLSALHHALTFAGIEVSE